MTETVFIGGSHKTHSGGRRNVYHTDRDCHQLAHGVREISLGRPNAWIWSYASVARGRWIGRTLARR